MADIIQIRRDIAENWTAANPTLAQGEFGVELDTYRIKIGNASDDWNSLDYFEAEFFGSTDEIDEGSTNLFFTTERARDSVSASGDIDYNSSTGVFSFTQRTDQEVRDLFSATGDLDYNAGTGVFSVTTYKSTDFDTDFGSKDTDDLSEGTGNLYFTTGRIDGHLTGGTGVNYDTGTISIGQPVGTTDDVIFNSVTATETIDTKFLNFDIPDDQYPVPPSVGGLQWNFDEGTLELGLNGTDAVLKIGQQTYYRVSNKSGSQIAKGTLVQFAGTVGQSGRLTIVPWDASVPPQFIMGITAETIPNDEDGFVIHFGKVRGINTTGTPFGETWANGDIIYAGVTGGLTNQKPEAPNTKTIIAAVISAHPSVGTLFVRPTLSSKLDDDDLVEFTSTLSDNDIILFNGDNARFENVSLSTEIVTEDASNLYFTETRARDSVSASGDIDYNSGTGVFSFTERTDQEVRDLLSATGDLSYNSSTGVFSVTTYKSTDFDTDFAGKDTDDLSEGTGNLYFTTGRIDDHLTGGTGVDYTTGTISIGQDVSTTANVEFADVVITGNLTVQGTETIIETAILQVEDQNIELGKVDDPDNTTANTGGLTVLAGADGDKTWKWLSATDSWTSSEHINVVSGKEYKVNGTTVLTNNTLGSGVTASSLTSVGTLNSGSITSGFGNIDIGSNTFTGNGSGLTNVDAVTLEGQDGDHYLDYGNFTNTPTNLSDFSNDENFITLNDLSASGDLSYNSATGEFSVTTYKSTDFDTDFAGKDTDDLSEGTGNLYFTQERARNSISVTGDLTYNPSTGVLGVDVPEGYDSSDFDTDFGNKDTDDLSEGTGNLYFTTGRIDDHLTGGTGVDYTTGTISIGQSVGTTDQVVFDTVQATSFNATSDATLKENIVQIENGLDIVTSLRGVRYDWKSPSVSPNIGVIAQEVEQVLPEVVFQPNGKGLYKSVSYGNIVAVLIEAIKELKQEVDDLKNSKHQ